MSCLALGLGKGDYLWTSPITFVASANCGLYCGAKVDFVDIDPKTYNLSAEALEIKLIAAEKTGTLPKIVIPVHFSGQSCDMKRIHLLGKRYGFSIIEDASHAIGGKYLGRPIGGCHYSDITVFSFHPIKIITTGEGGMAVTNNESLATKMALLRSHGITRDFGLMKNKSHGSWYYEQVDLGFNYRMTDIQAALGLSQMNRLDQYISKRHEIVKTYNAAFKDLPLTVPYQHPDTYSSFHLYIIRIKNLMNKKTRNEIFQQLRDQGIGINLHYMPVYIHPYYQEQDYSFSVCDESDCYYDECITLPLFPTMQFNEIQEVVGAVSSVVSRLS